MATRQPRPRRKPRPTSRPKPRPTPRAKPRRTRLPPRRRQAPAATLPRDRGTRPGCAAIMTIRRYLVAGLLVWVPLGITIWVLHLIVSTLDQTLLLIPEGLRPEALFGFRIPGLGVVLSFGLLLLTGAIAANF